MKLRLVATLAALPLALSACQQERPADRPAVAPAAKVVGNPESCIPLAQIRETRVRDDWTIDFIRDNKHAWRNTMPNRCPGLKMQDGFTYKTSLSQLCSSDIIYVLDTVGGGVQRGAGCGLGQFVPVELDR
ncbi:MAG: hypothetical protein WCY11_09555 [Novosphingobium sp.]